MEICHREMSSVLSSANFLKKLGFPTLYAYTRFEREYPLKAEELVMTLLPMEYRMREAGARILEEMKGTIAELYAKERQNRENLSIETKRKLRSEMMNQTINKRMRTETEIEAEEDEMTKTDVLDILMEAGTEKKVDFISEIIGKIISKEKRKMFISRMIRKLIPKDEIEETLKYIREDNERLFESDSESTYE